MTGGALSARDVSGGSLVGLARFAWRNALSELGQRYARSGLGALWLVVHPLGLIAVYWVVFSAFMEIRLAPRGAVPTSFALYLCAGLLPWVAFADLLTRGSTALRSRAGVILRGGVPVAVYFAQEALASLVVMGVSGGLVLAVAVAVGIPPALSWLCVPAILLLFAAFGCGLAMMLGVADVFSRDVGHALSLALQLAFWTVPIVYVETLLPASLRSVVVYGPLYPFVRALHDAMVFAEVPGPSTWAAMAGWVAAGVCGGAAWLFLLRADLRDELS